MLGVEHHAVVAVGPHVEELLGPGVAVPVLAQVVGPHVDLGLGLVLALGAPERRTVRQDLQQPVLEVFGGQVVSLVKLGRLVADRAQDVLAASEAAGVASSRQAGRAQVSLAVQVVTSSVHLNMEYIMFSSFMYGPKYLCK